MAIISTARCDARWELAPIACSIAGRRVVVAPPPPPPPGVMTLHRLADPEALFIGIGGKSLSCAPIYFIRESPYKTKQGGMKTTLPPIF
jgi:hypothetical protein